MGMAVKFMGFDQTPQTTLVYRPVIVPKPIKRIFRYIQVCK